MERIEAGYRAFTGYIFTAEQARAYNAALARAERCPNEANRNAAHNLFHSIALTPRANLNRRAVGGFMVDNGATVEAVDAFANIKATLPRERAVELMAAFDRQWPRADYLDGIRHLIANA